MLYIDMEDYGLVSIITPSYNSAKYIADTIEAICKQTYMNWELLITDDCSTDDSVKIIKNYMIKDTRIKLQQLDVNSGAGVCRNKSIEAAQGRYIAFCDSDDIWMPHKLEMQLRFINQKDCAFVYSSYMLMNEKKEVLGVSVCRNQETFTSMKRDNGIGCLTVLYDTAKVGKMYMSSLRKRQDWGLWLEILRKCKVAYGMKEPLAYYRLRQGSISNKKLTLMRHNVNVYRTILHYSLVKAYLFCIFVFVPNYFLKKLRIKMNSL